MLPNHLVHETGAGSKGAHVPLSLSKDVSAAAGQLQKAAFDG